MRKRKDIVNVQLKLIKPEHPGQTPLLEMWIDGKRVKSMAPMAVHNILPEEINKMQLSTNDGNDNNGSDRASAFSINNDGAVKVISDESNLTEQEMLQNRLVADIIKKRHDSLQ